MRRLKGFRTSGRNFRNTFPSNRSDEVSRKSSRWVKATVMVIEDCRFREQSADLQTWIEIVNFPRLIQSNRIQNS